jgi:hypothetical protein
VFLLVEIVAVNKPVPPETSVMLVVLSVVVGEWALAGSVVEDSVMFPVKPLRLVSVMVDVP